MNIEELKKLKEELENTKYTYITPKGHTILMRGKTVNEIIDNIRNNTNFMIEKCEKTFEQNVRYLIKNNIPFNEIALKSEIAFICENGFLNNLKGSKQDILKSKEFMKHTLNNYASLVIGPEYNKNGTKPFLSPYHTDDVIAPDSNIFGKIVNIDTFMNTIVSLGYDVYLTDYINCYGKWTNFTNYYNLILKNPNIQPKIEACFSKVKTKNKC